MEKSIPLHSQDVGSLSVFSKPPFFPSFPALSGPFQVHNLPPIPPGNSASYLLRQHIVNRNINYSYILDIINRRCIYLHHLGP